MADLDNLKEKYEGKRDGKLADTVKGMKSLTKQLEGKKESAPVRAAKQAISGFRSQWSGIDDEGKVGVGKGTPGIYYNTVAIPALAGIVDDKYAPEFAVEADKKAGRIRDAVRRDMGIEAPKGALEHFANAGGEMLAQAPIPGAWLKRVLTPVKELGVAGKIAASPVEYLSPTVDPKKINYAVGTGFGGTIGTVGEMLEEDPVKKALGGLIQKYEDGGKVGKVKSFFSAVDKAIDTLKQKKGTGEQILKEIEKAPGVKKEELELRKIREKLKDKKSITQDEVRALAAESPAPSIRPIVLGEGLDPDFLNQPSLQRDLQQLERAGYKPIITPDGRNMAFINPEGKKVDRMDAELEIGTRIDTSTTEQQAVENIGQRAGAVKSLNFLFDVFQNGARKNTAKFEKYTTPGGKNYREILLQLDRPAAPPSAALGGKPKEISVEDAANELSLTADDFNKDSTVLIYPSGVYIEKLQDGRYWSMVGNEDKISTNLEDIESFVARGMASELGEIAGAKTYRGGHFDENDVLAHVRTTDRTGPNGEKILYVEEIQSDWHQGARKARDKMIDDQLKKEEGSLKEKSKEIMESIGRPEVNRENAAIREGIMDKLMKARRAEISKEIPKDAGYAKPLSELEGTSADDLLWEYGDRLDESQKKWLRDYIERWELEADGTPAGQTAMDQLSKEYDDWMSKNYTKGIPDAPFKNTSNELAVKQIMDIAAKEGYDTVAFSPGSEHVKRYGMSEYFDNLQAVKQPNGRIQLIGTKDDRKIVDREVMADELADYIGKEKAESVLSQLNRPAPVNTASNELRGLVASLSQKYGDDFPITLREKLTPEELGQWDSLLEESRSWDKINRPSGEALKNEAMLRGSDLELTTAEGAGKKKIYDEIIPNFVRKYAKKEFGAEPGEIDIPLGKSSKTYSEYLDEINADPYQHFDEDTIFDELHERVMDKANVKGYDFKGEDADDLWDQMMSREGPFEDIWHEAEQDMYKAKAKELAAKAPQETLKAFSVPVTPQMREKITGEGQKLFAAAPVVGVQAIPGMEQAPQQAAPEQGQETEETPMPFEGGGKVGKVKSAAAAVRKVLSPESRKENLAKFLEKSEVKEPVYHAAKADVSKFSPKYRTELSNMGHHFGTAEQANARIQQYDFDSESSNIGKYHLNITKPLEVSHMASFAPDHLAEQMMDMNILDPDKYDSLSEKLNYDSLALGEELVKILKKEGYDGLKYPNEREGQGYSFVPFSPNQVKSGIGNIGAYDVNEADIGKKYGGPVGFQSGGQAMATPRSELEEDPFVQTVLNAARHYQAGKEIEAGQMGVSKGPVTVGVNAANIIDPGTRDKIQAQALFAAYRDKLGGVDVNASVNRPAQAPDGFYQGNVMASTPVGPGRAMAGVSGYKSPQKTDVSGYNFGYEQKVGPGYASGMVFQPKDRRQDTRYDVQYTVPFQLGGSVGLQDGGRVGKTRAAAEKLLRVLHGSPTRVTPESGKAMDVTTEPSYAVKRGTDKMLGKSGPPMVNQFDIPAGRMLQFEEQYSPEDVALMRRYFNKLPQDQAMRGEEIFDAAQGRDVILEGIAKAGGFAGYERPNTGAVGKGQWFRVTEPEILKLSRKYGGKI